MHRLKLQHTLLPALAVLLPALLAATFVQGSVQAQTTNADTPTPGVSSAYITQTYTEAINVRTGPSTVNYPVIGQLPVGATAPAIAASPSREWIQISYPSGPAGVGWIYAANVTLTGSLQVVEPPPTPTLLATATIDPTLAAAFPVEPTVTRLPTFTPGPPLAIPTFTEATSPTKLFSAGVWITALALVGAGVLAASLLTRR